MVKTWWMSYVLDWSLDCNDYNGAFWIVFAARSVQCTDQVQQTLDPRVSDLNAMRVPRVARTPRDGYLIGVQFKRNSPKTVQCEHFVGLMFFSGYAIPSVGYILTGWCCSYCPRLIIQRSCYFPNLPHPLTPQISRNVAKWKKKRSKITIWSGFECPTTPLRMKMNLQSSKIIQAQVHQWY